MLQLSVQKRSLKTSLLIMPMLAANLFVNSNGYAAESAQSIAEGKELAFDRSKGNCLACHMIDDGTLAGNNGPPLFAMKMRFPEASDLSAKIWDSNASNPNSIMPPFGRHGILTDGEIDKITAYLLTL